MTPDAIRKAFLATEQGFISLVSDQWDHAALLVSFTRGLSSSPTLGTPELFLGKSAPMGSLSQSNYAGSTMSEMEHNVSDEGIRQELIAEHPDDPQIVLLKHNVWRVRGIIQVGLILMFNFVLQYLNCIYSVLTQ